MNIFIHRKDLRLQDNNALINTTNAIPIFIFTPEQITNNKYFSNKFVKFMCLSLQNLKEEYKNKNSNLNLFYGNVIEVLKEINDKYNINSINFNVDYSPYSLKRDNEIKKWCSKNNIKVNFYEDNVLVNILQGNTLSKTSNTPYKVFTPFKNFLEKTYTIDKPNNKFLSLGKKILKTKSTINDLEQFYDDEDLFLKPGREHALKQLGKLTKQKKYAENRDYLTYKTSYLSVYINLGLISIREVYDKAIKILGKKSSFITELYWRDFYINIIYYFPHVVGNNFNPKFDKYKWSNNKTHLKAWKMGLTGFPIVDACMRQMNETGYMHNRGRMIVSSFLVKLLFIDWRVGEKYFATKLLDYNIASNNGGWQWSAGTGTDAQPFFRIFNPWEQGKKYDKNCEYIKKWVCELENVEIKDIHKWDVMYKEYEGTYPGPIIDYKARRKYALDYYNKNK